MTPDTVSFRERLARLDEWRRSHTSQFEAVQHDLNTLRIALLNHEAQVRNTFDALRLSTDGEGNILRDKVEDAMEKMEVRVKDIELFEANLKGRLWAFGLSAVILNAVVSWALHFVK